MVRRVVVLAVGVAALGWFASTALASPVSCPDTTHCFWGHEQWAQGRWHAHTNFDPYPAPTGSGELRDGAVSCTSSAACTIVGSEGSGTGLMVAERWDGHAWTGQTIAQPSAETNRLVDVSCADQTNCVAAGAYGSAGGLVPFAVRWDGTSWAVQALAATSPVTSLHAAVSCPAAGACIIVGYDLPIGPIAERFTGSNWVRDPMPIPSGATSAELSGISCTSPTDCIAVGGWRDALGDTAPLAEIWNGSIWQVMATPGIGRPTGQLSGISCAPSGGCIAVGSMVRVPDPRETVPLTERWDGATWTLQTVHDPPGALGGTITGVSCPASNACTAATQSVLGVESFSRFFDVPQRWNGTSWSIQPVPYAGFASAGRAQVKGARAIVPVRCLGLRPQRCRVTLRLTARGQGTVGARTISLMPTSSPPPAVDPGLAAASRARAVSVGLGRKGRRLLAARGRLRCKLVVTDPAARKPLLKARVVLRYVPRARGARRRLPPRARAPRPARAVATHRSSAAAHRQAPR